MLRITSAQSACGLFRYTPEMKSTGTWCRFLTQNIEIAPLSAYDQGCVELIQNSFSDYLQGKVDYDKAKKNFETAIIERYPDITEIQWPE